MRIRARFIVVLAGAVCLLAASAWAAGDDFSGTWAIRDSVKGGVITIDQSGDLLKLTMSGGPNERSFALRADGQPRPLRSSQQATQMVDSRWDGNALVVSSQTKVNDRVMRRVGLRVTRVDAATLSVEMTTRSGNMRRTRTLTLDRQQ